MDWTRRNCLAPLAATASLLAQEPLKPCPAIDALRMLLAGNRRYRLNFPSHPHQTGEYRVRTSQAQNPFAAILACADSRVPPEIIFDEGIGDLFVVRVAGNVVDDAVLGSLEYAVEHLGVELILVLGHSGCGAVKATLAGGEPGTHIEKLAEAIRPAVRRVPANAKDRLAATVEANVRLGVEQLKGSKPILKPGCGSGKLEIHGAVYELSSGAVNLVL